MVVDGVTEVLSIGVESGDVFDGHLVEDCFGDDGETWLGIFVSFC